ncbi:ABC transporter substrate-binding protein [Tateyamaria sp. ANG-S1]|uniref:ABC transporter substrate-binding protein n=1 Tax=Tateyamaria sp. ANG-S1 TaxID=1577905 RepID=UPI0005809D6A|nr:ABC transporter substrate-binding protein [Tateyamaria sp. ANG-S1]KIC48237.1 peptide ABC transporter substrate-binding protein [Tateyamaria sp. ANG-S1]
MFDRVIAAAFAGLLALPVWADAPVQESAFWAPEVKKGIIPAAADRIPDVPLIVDLEAKGRRFGTQGGTLRTMVTRTKDVRQMVVYGYARLVGYDHNYELKPDILRDVEVEEGRIFTLHLRPGHRWSDGAPFTSADFKYWWDHVANNRELSPNGPPEVMRMGDEIATMTFPDDVTVVVKFPGPNPNFLQSLAQASPPFIYRPSHYLKQFHVAFNSKDAMEEMIDKKRVRGWAPLHNKLDNMYKFDNHELPTLQPWKPASTGAAMRHLFVRNPFFHRVDARGVQLPYIDVVEMDIVGSGLVAAKTNAGESDLQARGLDFRDTSILKKGEADGAPYRTYLWSNGAASQIAIYPNLNFADPVWREVMRDARFRRALSLGIDRRMINRALYFGLGKEGGMTALAQSPLFDPANLTQWAIYDPDTANVMLDQMGLNKRTPAGIRLLPDGRPMEFVIETAGERQEVENALAIITDTWRDIGIQLIMRPLDRDILRNRVFSGVTMASVWFGWDNGLPQPNTPPSYLAPTDQVFFAWPKWGQYYQTHGAAGEPVDLEPAKRLMALSKAWQQTDDPQARAGIWREMLKIHADNQFGIGILSEAPQPVIVSDRLRNVPERGKWAWDPGAHFGVHRVDEFFFADSEQIAQVRE